MPSSHWSRPLDGALPAMNHACGGRCESEYRPALGREILRRMAAGETVKAIAADPQMPSHATIYRWRQVVPAFDADWRRLRAELAQERRARTEERLAAPAFWGPIKAQVAGRRWWRRGRPCSYTPAVGRAICARIARGEPMSRINADPAMPSAKVVYGWARRAPEFRDMLIAARQEAASRLEAAADLAAEQALLAKTFPGAWDALRAARRLDGRAGRLAPKVYRPPPR